MSEFNILISKIKNGKYCVRVCGNLLSVKNTHSLHYMLIRIAGSSLRVNSQGEEEEETNKQIFAFT